jgi:TFIIF-interacting CTD phosphatase-like protein
MLTHVLLDLDETLICSTRSEAPLDAENYKRVCHLEHHVNEPFTIFERPHLQAFLDYLFAHYKVSVFTASSKDYCLFIIDKFLLTKPDRHLEFVFFSYHCEISERRYANNSKRLRMLTDDFDLHDVFPLNSTVLIDDREHWALDQQDLVINIKPYHIEEPDSEHDIELVTVMSQLEMKRMEK